MVSPQRWGPSGCLEAWTTALVKWRSTATAAGGRCATTAGTSAWPPWCAPCSAAAPRQRSSHSSTRLSPTTTAASGTTFASLARVACGSAWSWRASQIPTCAQNPRRRESSATVGLLVCCWAPDGKCFYESVVMLNGIQHSITRVGEIKNMRVVHSFLILVLKYKLMYILFEFIFLKRKGWQ